ncbi:MAG TPA: hypothetical protein VM866_03610 [Pyrinomonadaceae bacterium]|jgi:hypothetical protein|nr:hypothetical protein [Pyrinomonadaceae bacterium]
MRVIGGVLCLLLIVSVAVIAAVPSMVDSVRKFDEYGDLPIGDEKARLDNFAFELRDNPNTVGYIIVYGGRRYRAGIAKTRAVRAKDYLVHRGIAPERIIWIYGGFRDELSHELFILPRGVSAPMAVPTVAPEGAQIIRDAKPKKRKQRISSKARKN